MLRFRLFLIAAAVAMLAAKTPSRPSTERYPVIDRYFDTVVTDEYRWLEDVSDPKVKNWVDAQNRHTRKYLDSIPTRPAIERRLRELYTARPASYFAPIHRGGRLFAMKNQP